MPVFLWWLRRLTRWRVLLATRSHLIYCGTCIARHSPCLPYLLSDDSRADERENLCTTTGGVSRGVSSPSFWIILSVNLSGAKARSGRHLEPPRLLGLFSLAGTGRAVCFSASINVRGRWCLVSRSANASSASCCKLLGEQFKRSQSFRIKADQFASHYLAKPLTVAWRRNLLPAKCLTSTVSFGSHHLTSFDLELLKEAQEDVRR